MRTAVALVVLSVVFPFRALYAQSDWPTFGHDPGGQRYSPLKQVNTSNVAKLTPAWTLAIDPVDSADGQWRIVCGLSV